MIHEDSIITLTSEQVACDMKGELLILHTASGTYFGLNPVGKRVWSLIHEPRRAGDIRDVLLNEYHVDRETCTRHLLALLEKLASKRLIKVNAASLA
jgi:hypothetical protein